MGADRVRKIAQGGTELLVLHPHKGAELAMTRKDCGRCCRIFAHQDQDIWRPAPYIRFDSIQFLNYLHIYEA